jgi:hypothetical protein
MDHPPEFLLMGLQWLIQALVDELEKHDVRSLRVRTLDSDEGRVVEFLAEKDGLPETFAEGLHPRPETPEGRRLHPEDAGMVLSASLLRQSGVVIERDPAPSHCRIALFIAGP